MNTRTLLPSRSDLRTWIWWKRKLLKHFLPLGFAAALIVGLAWPWPGVQVSDPKVGDYQIMQTIHIVTIFVISGFTLKTADLVAAIKHPHGLIFGLASIILITPLLGYAMIQIPFDDPSFATGFAIFCSVPTTLASGAALVKAAYGNDALALFFCVAGNIIGIFSVPFFLELQLKTASATADLSIDPVNLIVQLSLTILLPAIIGRALQAVIPNALEHAARHKTALFLGSNGSLVLIVWQSVSRAQADIVNTAFGQIVLLLLAAIAMHLIYLAFNTAAARVLRLPPREAKAVIIMGSQKTLPIAVTLIAYMPLTFGSPGVLSVPCIMGHISQLFIDAAIVSRMASKEEARLAEAAATGAVVAPKGSGDGSDCSLDKPGASCLLPVPSQLVMSAATSRVDLSQGVEIEASRRNSAQDAGPLAVVVDSSSSNSGGDESAGGDASWGACTAGDGTAGEGTAGEGTAGASPQKAWVGVGAGPVSEGAPPPP